MLEVNRGNLLSEKGESEELRRARELPASREKSAPSTTRTCGTGFRNFLTVLPSAAQTLSLSHGCPLELLQNCYALSPSYPV